MYAYIVGKVDSVGIGFLVVEAGGVGYLINASDYTIGKIGRVGETVKVYTYLAVREDDMSLYGFYSEEERRMLPKVHCSRPLSMIILQKASSSGRILESSVSTFPGSET